ncbi:Protein of unknown function (DUF1906) [Brevibacillus sp. CF112]|uniref:DUF1906 domain-containing protein n=1 Tax=Brevibacillus TaxID=55080 RepID=UPI000271A2B1|nr:MULTISPECIES: DUF1906 domain-containing protein [Brevibacillus]EJL38959.1 Protein of unknown function (DUF1906) [Brevibacillus sp. CF112]MBY0054772.1 DUF1906 domain-containing protein [Brevibacillus agri]
MKKGIDCAVPLTATLAKQIAAAGYEFVCRYLVPQRYTWKRLTSAEVEAIRAAGMQIISVFETSAARPAGGASAGQVDGQEAYNEAKLIGQPLGSAIYFAVDYDAQPSDYDKIEQYLRAAAGKIPGYAVGVYGSYAVVEEMAKRKACTHFWQTYAWSRGKRSAHANIYQYKNGTMLPGINHTLDLNESYGNEGFWEVKPKMKPEDAQKIIAFLGAGWQATESKEARDEFHRLANEVRKAAGIPIEKNA